ncbi:2-hydroxyacid dehydrogenase [Pseudooceanicola onchidii]|uniref:2-hydroxyacid dehydrogenase n=1 Tax=Pseudooceanicola onchidii TaxID=2562279 RepID=UPI0010AB4618|nr:glyoxylate/hydroxypyruvate reductase A [Pseudooceanicola onchidii]
MTLNILFAAGAARWQDYQMPLREGLAEAEIDANLSLDLDPAEVDYIVYAPDSDLQDFTPYTRCKAVLNLWAGVEGITNNATLTQPLARMVDPGLTQGMVEWVTGHVLRHHLDIDYALARQDGTWDRYVPPLASDRPVTILGMGELGAACAQALVGLGFPVTGWSRRGKAVDGVTMLSGDEGLDEALSSAQILVLLLPKTPGTVNLIDAAALSKLPEGAVIVNPGRGPLIDDDALLAALESGHVRHATLDVFRVEPLPADHPYWAHPRVTVTPHIASETRAASAARVVVENIRRGEADEPFLHLVDRDQGY